MPFSELLLFIELLVLGLCFISLALHFFLPLGKGHVLIASYALTMLLCFVIVSAYPLHLLTGCGQNECQGNPIGDNLEWRRGSWRRREAAAAVGGMRTKKAT